MNSACLLYNARPDYDGGMEPLMVCQTEEMAEQVLAEMYHALDTAILNRPKGIQRDAYLKSIEWPYGIDLSTLLPFRFPKKIPKGYWGIEKMILPCP